MLPARSTTRAMVNLTDVRSGVPRTLKLMHVHVTNWRTGSMPQCVFSLIYILGDFSLAYAPDGLLTAVAIHEAWCGLHGRLGRLSSWSLGL